MTTEHDNDFELLLAQWFDLALTDFGFITRAIAINRGHAAIECIKDRAFEEGKRQRKSKSISP